MSRPNIFKRFAEGWKAATNPTIINPIAPYNNMGVIGFNTNVALYTYGNESTYINKGYKKNAWVYSIVNKCAKKFSQVPWYHYKIKTNERKTWAEYQQLTKLQLPDIKARIEARKMRTKAVDQVMAESPLSALLQRPNGHQPRAKFMENLYGYKLLSGEGNIWLPTLADERAPTSMYVIPKANIALVKGGGPWAVNQYKLIFAGQELAQETDKVILWSFASYDFDPVNLTHLRGQSPLDAGLLTMQSSNEAAERSIAMNRNQGAAGLVYDKGVRDFPTPEQAAMMRRQFNGVVNDKDLAGAIAYMTGDLGYFQLGLTAEQLKLLEQKEADFKALCNIFDVPWQLFGNADGYENRKQYKRDFIYDNIAVAAYSLRDEMNARLIPAFNLDRDRDVIDCDVLSLPELAQDQKEAAEFLDKMGPRLTLNEGREYMGWDRSTDPNLDKHYISGSLQTLDQANQDMGAGLDEEVNLLEDEEDNG